MLEIAQNRGDSYESIRLMLDDLDRYWLPSDLDSETVSQRERQGVRPPAVFLVPVEMLSGIIQALPLGTYSLGAALAKLHDADFVAELPNCFSAARACWPSSNASVNSDNAARSSSP